MLYELFKSWNLYSEAVLMEKVKLILSKMVGEKFGWKNREAGSERERFVLKFSELANMI